MDEISKIFFFNQRLLKLEILSFFFFYYFGKSSEQKYALNRNFILQKYGNKPKVADF